MADAGTRAAPGSRAAAAEVLLTLDRAAPVALRSQLEDGLRELGEANKGGGVART
jgi:hypothetical protein